MHRIAIFAFLALLAAGTDGAAQESTAEGLVVVESAHSVEETQRRLEQALEANDLIVVAVVAHDENAAAADLRLRPTRLVIFGNPQVGTQLMQAERTVAIDLPQKMLIWEDDAGIVRLAYNDPSYLASRHGIDDLDELLGNVADALHDLAEAATAP